MSIFISCKNENKIGIFGMKESCRIEKIADIGFRRSYADHQYLTDKQLDSLYKTNPSLLNYKESEIEGELFINLEKLKILDGDGLIIKRFEEKNLENQNYLDRVNNIKFNYSSNFDQSNSINLRVENGKKVIKKKIEFENEHFVGIILEDIDNDRIKEIIILSTYYIMNGDNYDLIILKLVE